MSVEARSNTKHIVANENILKLFSSMSSSEGIEVLKRILESPLPALNRVIVSIGDLAQTIETIPQSIETILQTIETSKHPRPELSNDYVAPRNQIEQKIADIWKEIIRVEQVGIYDNFFDLGGDSLLGLQIISKLNTAFDLELTMTKLYECPNIDSIAKALVPEESKDNKLEERLIKRQRRRQMKIQEKS